MKVAYYYNQQRFPKGDTRTNPYGPSLVEGLEKLGLEFEFSERIDARWLLQKRKEIQILHHNWPSYEYKQARQKDRPLKVYPLWVAFVARLAFARLLGYKIVWTMHNLYPHNTTYRHLDHLARLALCRFSNSIIVHCQHAKRLAAEHFGRTERVYVIPHGHFIGAYPNEISREEARRRLGIPQSNFCYMLFGSVQPYKGVDRLIRTFSSLEGDDLSLIIAGGVFSAYAQTIVPEAEKDKRIILRLEKRVPSEDLQVYYNAADVVVQPFSAVLTSGTVILALSWKKPIILPALGCLRELMTEGMGIMYDPTDPDALRKAMVDIRTEDVRAMGENAYRRVSTFGWDRIAALTLEAYQEA